MRFDDVSKAPTPINELWDRAPSEAKWILKDEHEWIARIPHEKQTYTLTITNQGGRSFISLGKVGTFWAALDRILTGGHGMASDSGVGTGTTRDTLSLFGSVIKAMETFMAEAKPRFVILTGMTNSHDKLYRALAKRMQPILDRLHYVVEHHGTIIQLVRTNLTEAPITNMTLDGPNGDFNAGTGFDAVDRKLLQSPKATAKIVRAFAHCPFEFEIFFMNSADIDATGKDNEEVDTLVRRIGGGIYDDFSGVKGKDGVIRVVMLSNLSPRAGRVPGQTPPRMPMTPWTLAHKIGHSFQDDIINRAAWGSEIGKVVSEINTCLAIFADPVWGHSHNGGFAIRGDLRHKMTMKSARDGHLTNSFEFFPEVVAQYLITGRATFKHVEHNFPLNSHTELTQRLNLALRKLFTLCQGKVLVEL